MTTQRRTLFAVCVAIGVLALGTTTPRGSVAADDGHALRVCADPDNLPFSDADGGGFENRLAQLLASDLGATVVYTWWAQRRGFLRETLTAGRCDVVLGLPARIEAAWTTRPYYRSSYVFVQRGGAPPPPLRSLDDARLRQARIAVPLVSDDGANAPPAHALARRGLAGNLLRFSVHRAGLADPPGARTIAAVARGDVDVAVAWGPVAGYFAARRGGLRVTPIEPQIDRNGGDAAGLPLAFDISMATRRGDTVRHAAIESFLVRRRAEIDRLLAAFHVPVVPRPPGAAF